MRKIVSFASVLLSLLLVLGLVYGVEKSFAQSQAKSQAKEKAERLFENTLKNYDDVQVITACDGRKRVIVEGYKEGEMLPRDKAKKAAVLLKGLIKYCTAEIVAVIPENKIDVRLSIDGEPFFMVTEAELELNVRLVHGGQEHTKKEKRIWDAQVKRLVKKGYSVFHSSITGTNGISCDMCHPDGTNTHPETYPKFQPQLKKVVLLRDMINWCIEKPMEGKPLAHDSKEMKAIEAYILSTREGVKLEYGKH